jgi:hypothetical protein
VERVNLHRGDLEIVTADDVVTAENVLGFVAADRHRNALGNTTADHVAHGGEEVDLEGVKKLVIRNADGEATFKGNKVGALNVARQAVMDIAKIMGLIVDKVAPTDGKGNDLTLADLAARAREARAERVARELPVTH